MATPVYTQADFYEMVDGMMHQKFSQTNDRQVIVNRAVRFVLGDMDMRSTKRNSQLSPNLFKDVYDYTAPSDLKQNKIIDIRKQVNRLSSEGWIMVDETDFNRYKEVSNYRIAVADDDFSRILKIDGVEGDVKIILNNCNSLTADGTWAVSADGTNLTLDSNNYLTGTGALNFDTDTGAATAVLSTADMNAKDLSTHDEQGSVFVWVYVPTTFTIANLTNFILRWGNDSSNYWHKTVTTQNDGTSFKGGWNLLRFDWDSATEVGTVDPETVDYLHLTITKDTGEAANTDWRVDDIVFRVGDIYNVVYYTKYGWQNSGGTYIEESSATTDLLMADTDEIEIIAFKAAEIAAQELVEREDREYFRQQYIEAKRVYETQAPSEALRIHRAYYQPPALGRGRGWKRTS